MARTDREFKRAYNRLLERLSFGGTFTSVSELARLIDVSRTTARKVIGRSEETGLFHFDGRSAPEILRSPAEGDYFALAETLEQDKFIEVSMLRWMVGAGLRRGMVIDDTLAAELGLPLPGFRDWLSQIEKFGIAEKRGAKSWVYTGLSEKLLVEIRDIRVFMESRTIRHLGNLPKSSAFWPAIERLRVAHEEYGRRAQPDRVDFVELEYRFHSLLYESSDLPLLEHLRVLFCFIMFRVFASADSDEAVGFLTEKAITAHLEIIDAVRKRKTALGRRLIEQHLSESLEFVLPEETDIK